MQYIQKSSLVKGGVYECRSPLFGVGRWNGEAFEFFPQTLAWERITGKHIDDIEGYVRPIKKIPTIYAPVGEGS